METMKVVAVTSCATGIAHTYMAAEAIMKVCKERGYKCKVEKQGALGLEDKLRDRDIKEADLIVFANDVGLTKAERFEPYKDKIFQTKPHEVIKDPNIIFSGRKETEQQTATSEMVHSGRTPGSI